MRGRRLTYFPQIVFKESLQKLDSVENPDKLINDNKIALPIKYL